MITADLLLAAVNTRLNQKNVLQTITNGITWGMPQSRPQPPYGWIDGLNDTKFRDTNTSRLRTVPWTLHLILNNPPEDAAATARVVMNALLFAPLILSSGTVLLNQDDPGSQPLEEDFFWHWVLQFRATVQQAANYSPG